jgi:hypothetical protein
MAACTRKLNLGWNWIGKIGYQGEVFLIKILYNSYIN